MPAIYFRVQAWAALCTMSIYGRTLKSDMNINNVSEHGAPIRGQTHKQTHLKKFFREKSKVWTYQHR